ncbi:MAG: NUDIX domain-containing protein [Patescibacteria group bacterium]
MKTFDIQKEIFRKLVSQKGPLRYRDMKPEDVENDLYNYHLQFLVTKGYIVRSKDGYSLTDKGHKYISDEKPIDPLGNISDLFKVNVITVVYRKNTDNELEILMQKRTRHPSMGHILVPGGSIRKGESWLAASERNIKTETGILITNPELKAFGRRIALDGEDVFMDSFYLIAITDEFEGNLLPETEFGENVWMKSEDAIKAQKTQDDNLLVVAKVIEEIGKNTQLLYSEERKMLD